MLEADFQRFYGADLGAVVFGRRRWDPRRLWALVRHLPAEAMLRVVLAGGDGAGAGAVAPPPRQVRTVRSPAQAALIAKGAA